MATRAGRDECVQHLPLGAGNRGARDYEANMPSAIEIHGRAACPFAWRVRLAAAEKGVPFDWIAYDAERPDARAAHNSDKRSPLLIHGDFRLTESGVIAQYIDEAFPGPALMPSTPAARALARVDIAELQKLEVSSQPPLTPETRTRVSQGYELLDKKLADGRHWLGGETPNLADLLIWPHVTGLHVRASLPIPPALERAAAYWQRVSERPSYLSTRCPWAITSAR
jgi:glutathione S-transferase